MNVLVVDCLNRVVGVATWLRPMVCQIGIVFLMECKVSNFAHTQLLHGTLAPNAFARVPDLNGWSCVKLVRRNRMHECVGNGLGQSFLFEGG